jgi:hypothetical protein
MYAVPSRCPSRPVHAPGAFAVVEEPGRAMLASDDCATAKPPIR